MEKKDTTSSNLNNNSNSDNKPKRNNNNRSRKPGSKPSKGGPGKGGNNNNKRLSATERLRMRSRRKPNRDSIVSDYKAPELGADVRLGLEKLVHSKEMPTEFKEKVKIYFVGGCEQVGQNMTVVEVEDDLIVIDVGLQFPEENMPGIDYIIPDVDFLEKNKERIRGVVITHGHYDHIGAIPQVMKKIGFDIPIYGTRLTIALIERRQEEYEGALNLIVFDPDDVLYLGKMTVEFFRVNHNIPDCVGIAVNTPGGFIIHTGDWKLDHSPINEEATNFAKITELGQRGVLALLADSTNAYLPGYQVSEDEIKVNLDTIFQQSEGTIYTALFASLISRIQQLILLAEKYDRKVCILGRSMISNVDISLNLGYIKAKKGTLVTAAQAKSLPRNKLLIVCTGAQGEGPASLTRVAKGNHKDFHLEPGDSVTFSSSIVKGNERSVQYLRDLVYKHDVKVYHTANMDVHAGGHAKQEEAKLIANLLRPKYFVPIEANYFMLKEHARIIEQAGLPIKRIFIPQNGSCLTITESDAKMDHDVISHRIMVTEGNCVRELTDLIIDDRMQMAENGIFTIIINVKNRKTISNPDIISRGYIYLRDSKDLMEKARNEIKNEYEKAIEATGGNIKETKRMIVGHMEKFLYDKVGKSPVVIAVINDVTRKVSDDEFDEDFREANILTSSNVLQNSHIDPEDNKIE